MCLLATDGDNVHIATEDKESSYQSTLYAKHCCTNNTGENSIKHLTVETGKIEITFCQQSPGIYNNMILWCNIQYQGASRIIKAVFYPMNNYITYSAAS